MDEADAAGAPGRPPIGVALRCDRDLAKTLGGNSSGNGERIRCRARGRARKYAKSSSPVTSAAKGGACGLSDLVVSESCCAVKIFGSALQAGSTEVPSGARLGAFCFWRKSAGRAVALAAARLRLWRLYRRPPFQNLGTDIVMSPVYLHRSREI
jgi:hypothetical protein